jgi:cytochrome c556
MSRHVCSAAFVVAIIVAIATVAHAGAVDVAKERRDLMQAMEQAMNEIAKRIATKRDLAAIGENAIKVRQAGETMLQLFPAGSEVGATEAKPNIWKRWDLFQAKTRNLVQAARALEKVDASADLSAISARYVAVRRACGECHVLFRQGQ